MRKRCVPGPLFGPGDEANPNPTNGMTTDSQPAVLVGAATQLNSQEARNGQIHNIINK